MPRFPIGTDGRYNLPKLTAADLRALYFQCPEPETRALLWDIHRLRILVVHVDQLQRTMASHCHISTLQVLESLRAALAGEPCVLEHAARIEETFEPHSAREYTRKCNRRD